MNIVLTGMMGSGKSTVGKKLASRLNFNYIDTDDMIEEQVGKSINEIFEKAGQEAFRRLEKDSVRLVALLDGYVISAGGGVVTDRENIKELKKKSVIVYLAASPEVLYERLKKKNNRPLLKVNDPLAKLKEILKERRKEYSKADITVETSGKKPSRIAGEIIEKVEELKKD
ncbi:MAG: shikimate kinase [Elusimicrobiota bacterium]|nr:shikimate kinase [Elusimicrobiota bacterium]